MSRFTKRGKKYVRHRNITKKRLNKTIRKYSNKKRRTKKRVGGMRPSALRKEVIPTRQKEELNDELKAIIASKATAAAEEKERTDELQAMIASKATAAAEEKKRADTQKAIEQSLLPTPPLAGPSQNRFIRSRPANPSSVSAANQTDQKGRVEDLCSKTNIKDAIKALRPFLENGEDIEQNIMENVLKNMCKTNDDLQVFLLNILNKEVDNLPTQELLGTINIEYHNYQVDEPGPPINEPITHGIDTIRNTGIIGKKVYVTNKCWVISLANMYSDIYNIKVSSSKLYNFIIRKIYQILPEFEKLPDVFYDLIDESKDTDGIEFIDHFNIPLQNGIIIISIDNGSFTNWDLRHKAFFSNPLNKKTPVIVNFGNYHFEYGKDTVTIQNIRQYIIDNRTKCMDLSNLQRDPPTINISEQEIIGMQSKGRT